MSAIVIFLHLAIAIAIILFLTIKYKINASLTLVIASIYMGIACGLGPVKTVGIVGSGFGGTMAGLGLAIGFGVILGQLLSDSGGAYVIADRMTTIFPERKALAAITATAFILAIPVFFDVTFVILMPIGIALAKKIDRPLLEVSSMLTLGAVTAHTLVPPTPNPLAAAEIFKFDLGVMIIMGILIGGGACVIAGFIILRIQRRPGFWNPVKDVNKSYVMTESPGTAVEEGRRLPSFGISLLPVFLPVFLILRAYPNRRFSFFSLLNMMTEKANSIIAT